MAGIPSRCRQDVGGNTWKCWQGAEGPCNSDRSGATPLQLHEAARSQQLPSQRLLWCGATAGSYAPTAGAAALRGKELPFPVGADTRAAPQLRLTLFPLLLHATAARSLLLGVRKPARPLGAAAPLSPRSAHELRIYPHAQPCSFLLFQELLLPAALLHPRPKPQMSAHNRAPGFPFPFFPLQQQPEHAARPSLCGTLPHHPLT